MKRLTMNFAAPSGKVKPMHGVNNAPVFGYYGYEHMHYMTEAGIPFSRLHDTGGYFGGARFVDVENIFPNIDTADETDPANYDFAITDRLIEELYKAGMEPVYRLGATIENGHFIKAYRIYPPKDFAKYARVCANIVRHYNHGWADGFHNGIRYWEIWNEPDNSNKIEENPCWKGTKEQFFEFYRTIACYLREQFPEILIGGYASSGMYACMTELVPEEVLAAAHVSPRYKSFLTFFTDFLDYITAPETAAPLDFFTWHSYARVEDNVHHAAYVRRELDKRGLTQVESVLNEWNPNFTLRGKPEHAAWTAQMFLGMHPLVDQMEFYTGCIQSTYASLFEMPAPMDYRPTKTYYTFKMFNELYRLGQAVPVSSEDDRVYALGATDGEAVALMLANGADEDVSLALDGAVFAGKAVTARLIDGEHTDEEVPCDPASGVVTLPPYGVLLIQA